MSALERGDPPPPSFAGFDSAFARWDGIPKPAKGPGTGPEPRIDPAVLALHTVVMARHANPLIAVLDSVRNAATLDDTGTALSAFRASFGLP